MTLKSNRALMSIAWAIVQSTRIMDDRRDAILDSYKNRYRFRNNSQQNEEARKLRIARWRKKNKAARLMRSKQRRSSL